MTDARFDALVVGAGAAGSLVAAKLAAAGKRPLVLDAGPGWTIADLVSSPIWARRLKWDPGPSTSRGAQPINVGFNAGYGLGGAALHHYACWFRLHSEDFHMRSLYGRGQDWPIAYADLRPFYDQMQREVGISGDAAAEVWRRDRFGVPRAQLTHRYAPDTLRLHAAVMEEGERVLRAAGASEAWAAPMAQQHILGGTAMGADAAGSIANGFGQAHDHENLFLAGAGLFPTSGAVNPTFTVCALALRTADYIIRNWSSLA